MAWTYGPARPARPDRRQVQVEWPSAYITIGNGTGAIPDNYGATAGERRTIGLQHGAVRNGRGIVDGGCHIIAIADVCVADPTADDLRRYVEWSSADLAQSPLRAIRFAHDGSEIHVTDWRDAQRRTTG